MNLCILGWYGSETLGDRAILAGIFKIFSCFGDIKKIEVGSIYKFYSDRTDYEEKEYFSRVLGNIAFSFFDAKDKNKLKSTIKKSHIVLMGGGPIMELYELEIIYESFMYAKKNKITTGLFGCGVDLPSDNRYYEAYVRKICKCANFIIMRDQFSKDKLVELGCKKKIYVCHDPAFLGVDTTVHAEVGQYVVVNLRDFGYNFSPEDTLKIHNRLLVLLTKLCEENERVLLVSNHTFVIGGDDREYYERIKLEIKKDNLVVISEPLSLEETFKIIKGAKACFGMRYHAVLFQTLLNGNNYIIDYTEPNVGKISGFLSMIPNNEFYKSRYVNIMNKELDTYFFDEQKDHYSINQAFFDAVLREYVEVLVKEVGING